MSFKKSSHVFHQFCNLGISRFRPKKQRSLLSAEQSATDKTFQTGNLEQEIKSVFERRMRWTFIKIIFSIKLPGHILAIETSRQGTEYCISPKTLKKLETVD